VATSTNIENNAIESLCNQLNISCFRGSEDDILSRFQGAIKYYNIQDDDLIVRICCDCPLTDPLIIDDIIHFHGDNDLTTNCIVRTFPDGLDVECFKAGILKHPNFNEINFFELEYNINFLFNNNFKIFNLFNQKGDLSHLRWTLDTPADFEFIKGIYEKFYHSGKMFLMEDILKCLGENK
jgi:spore coat polysaccharide biosynthesis protein SpsF